MIALAKPITRKTARPFRHYRVPLVIELLPGDVLRLREHGRREKSSVSVDLHQLYEELVQRKIWREKMERAKARKAKRKR